MNTRKAMVGTAEVNRVRLRLIYSDDICEKGTEILKNLKELE
jgi:hypothetical protein